jgi:hypothetical protein
MVSNDYKPGENKFTGKILKVTIDTKPSNLRPADKKAAEDEQAVAAAIEDRFFCSRLAVSRRDSKSLDHGD